MTTLATRPQPRIGLPIAAGIALIAAGLLLGLEKAGIAVPDQMFRLWPLLLLLLGAARLHARGLFTTGGHVLLFLGACFLAVQFAPDLAERFAGPAALLWLGVIISLRALWPSSPKPVAPASQPADE
jgi:hypothetical protein